MYIYTYIYIHTHVYMELDVCVFKRIMLGVLRRQTPKDISCIKRAMSGSCVDPVEVPGNPKP